MTGLVKRNGLSPDHQIYPAREASSFYFVCTSPGHVLPALGLIEQLQIRNEDIHIVTVSPEMSRCWNSIIKNNKLQWHVHCLDTGIHARFRNIASWFTIRPLIRKIYDNNFESVNNCLLYCFGTGLDFVLLAVMKRVSESNRVIFMEHAPDSFPPLLSLKSLIVFIHIYLFYGIREIKILNVNNQPYPFLSDSFYNKMKIEKNSYHYFYNADLARKYNPVANQLAIGKTILWLDDDCGVNEKNEGDTFRLLTALRQHVTKKAGKEKVLYKRHPNPSFHSTNMDSVYQGCTEYPSHIPADFILCDSQIKFVIGGCSVTLSVAGKHTHAVAISYVKLIPFRNEAYKQHLMDYWLQESGGKVVFPDSIEEFISLISEP